MRAGPWPGCGWSARAGVEGAVEGDAPGLAAGELDRGPLAVDAQARGGVGVIDERGLERATVQAAVAGAGDQEELRARQYPNHSAWAMPSDTRPDIVIVQSESLFDPARLRNAPARTYLPNYHRLAKRGEFEKVTARDRVMTFSYYRIQHGHEPRAVRFRDRVSSVPS